MKSLILLCFAWLAWNPLAQTEVKKEAKGDFAPVVVLELFTSQGCSSCPPADALLSKLLKENQHSKIIGMSFHVSYWNHLGWADPYSSDSYSNRQNWYHQTFSSGVYTPQVVVNGADEYVGSNKATSATKIKEALAKPATLAIDLSLSGNKLNYHLNGQYANAVLNIVTVEDEASNYVKRGENKGKQLTHSNVVLSLATQKVNGSSGEIQLSIPTSTSKVIVFAQNPKNGTVLGATQLTI